jgi:hypothetical protein
MTARRRKHLPPAALLALLTSSEGIRTIAAAFRHEHTRRLRKERRRISRDTPSGHAGEDGSAAVGGWAEAAWVHGQRWPAAMIRCRQCGRYTPPVAMTTSGHCYDCWLATFPRGSLTSSPSALAIRAIAASGRRPRFVHLSDAEWESL